MQIKKTQVANANLGFPYYHRITPYSVIITPDLIPS